jgi:hypothetical protein
MDKNIEESAKWPGIYKTAVNLIKNSTIPSKKDESCKKVNMKDRSFNFEQQFFNYIKTVGLNEKKMSPIQYVELHRAFVAGVTQLVMYMYTVIGDTGDDDAVDLLEAVMRQVEEYWKVYRKE